LTSKSYEIGKERGLGGGSLKSQSSFYTGRVGRCKLNYHGRGTVWIFGAEYITFSPRDLRTGKHAKK